MIDRKITVTFEAWIPSDATDEQVMDWLRLNLSSGSCDGDNPLVDLGIEAEASSITLK